MAKVFYAKVRKISDSAFGITIPKEVFEGNHLEEDTAYWFRLMGKVKHVPGVEQV